MPIGYNEAGVYSTLEVDMREEDDQDQERLKQFAGDLGRYEDQVVPAKRKGLIDLDAEIEKYEKEQENKDKEDYQVKLHPKQMP